MLALSQDVQQNRPVEAREHIRRFHELFFSLSPDKSAIESNVQRALYLSDESAIGYYRNLQEKGYFNRMIAGNISQTLTVDSIRGNFDSYPYRMKAYCRQHIIRSSSVTERSLVTTCRLRTFVPVCCAMVSALRLSNSGWTKMTFTFSDLHRSISSFRWAGEGSLPPSSIEI